MNSDTMPLTIDRLLDAVLPHVAFDGWSDVALVAGARDLGFSADATRAVAPRGALDLALAFHRRGDRAMVAACTPAAMAGLGYSAKVAFALRARIDAVAAEREAVRRGATLLALPQNAAHGAAAIWQTADAIWTALGDTSRDVNWYTKRATLSAVWSSVLLFWLGDQTPGHGATDAFIDRRIADVMRLEKAKAQIAGSPAGKLWQRAAGPVLDRIRAPAGPAKDMPGHIRPGR